MEDTMAAAVLMEHRLRGADIDREGWKIDASSKTRREWLAGALIALAVKLAPAAPSNPLPGGTSVPAHA